MTTLRSRKILKDLYEGRHHTVSTPEHENDQDSLFSDREDEEEHIIIEKSEAKENAKVTDLKGKAKIAPFPIVLESRTKLHAELDKELMKIFQHIQITIPFADAIKHIPAYAKFLKNLCTPHRSPRRITLSEEASTVISHSLPRKCKDPGAPLISCKIGNVMLFNALLDLGVSVNL